MAVSTTLQISPARILVIAMRFLGDVLLATPLVHSLKQAYPDARIDILVFRSTAEMLEGNPDIDHVISIPNRSGLADLRYLLPRLFRRYDLAISVQSGDRPFIYSLLAAPVRIAIVPPKGATGWWKRFFIQGFVEHDNENTHTVLQNLKLLKPLDIPPCFTLIPPDIDNPTRFAEKFPYLNDGTRYAILHPHPQWTYKRWTMEGWIDVGRHLHRSGLRLVLTGGPAREELDYVANVQRELPEDTVNLAGLVSLAELARIIAGAQCFIGPDTGITHLASAVRVPVIALFGPTNPVKWAPWPWGFDQERNPFQKTGDQRVNNVHLVQGEGACVPCDLEGCDRHRHSRSRCLDTLSVRSVIETVLKALSNRE
ncbi:MAG: putative lipopolysaccharide heptosyltransferase III [Gammaproteobacteria bacterium]